MKMKKKIGENPGVADMLKRIERMAATHQSKDSEGNPQGVEEAILDELAASMVPADAEQESSELTPEEVSDSSKIVSPENFDRLRKERQRLAKMNRPPLSAEDFDHFRREREIELNRLAKQEREEMLKEKERKRNEAILGHDGIPKRFKRRNFDNFESRTSMLRDAADSTRNFVEAVVTMREHEGSPGTLMLLGAPGLGKTHLGVAMVRAAQESGLRAFYSSPHKYLRDLRRSFDLHNTREVDALYGDAELLVLDEVTRITSSEDFYLQSMFTLIDYRYENDLPTVLIGNHHQAEIKRVFGEALWRRVEEDGMDIVRLSPEPGEAEMTHNLGWRPRSYDPYGQ